MNRTQFLLSALMMSCAAIAQQVCARDVPAQAVKSAQSDGVKVFQKWCSDCHSTKTGPGSLALERKYQGSVPAVLERRSDLSPDYVKLVVRHGISFMPSFRKTEISDAELALIATYLAPAQASTHRAKK